MVNFAKALVTKVWKLVLGFFGVLRRAMCCFRKRRRASDVGLPVYLTAHGTEPCTMQQLTDDLQSWDSWNEENGPVSVQVDSSGNQGTAGGAQRHAAAVNGPMSGRPSGPGSRGSGDQRRDSQSDDDVDFFKDMTPTNIRQKKYIPRAEDGLGAMPGAGFSSRLKFDARAVLPYQGAELGVLEDHDDTVEASWEDQAELEVDSAIREKRQAERERRIAEHQRRKREKEQLRTGTGNVAPTTSGSGPHSSPPSTRRKVF
uniref:Putative receptor-binding cancer antigen n=1 Tax=Rhipicephalus pulchellus TaxID=72859 RepID=L7M040_RHIPC